MSKPSASSERPMSQTRHLIAFGTRWILAAILVWAGLSKLADPTSFYGAMLAYRLPFPHVLLKFAAVTLPWMELLCGLLLMAGIAKQANALWICVLFATFSILVGQALLRGLDISCGCFNLSPLGIDGDSRLAHILESVGFATLRNVVLLAAALFLWKSYHPSCPPLHPLNHED